MHFAVSISEKEFAMFDTLDRYQRPDLLFEGPEGSIDQIGKAKTVVERVKNDSEEVPLTRDRTEILSE